MEFLITGLENAQEKIKLCESMLSNADFADRKEYIKEKLDSWKEHEKNYQDQILKEHKRLEDQHEALQKQKDEASELQDKYKTWYDEGSYKTIQERQSDLEKNEERQELEYYHQRYGVEIPKEKPTLQEGVRMVQLGLIKDARAAMELGLSWDDLQVEILNEQTRQREEERHQQFIVEWQAGKKDFEDLLEMKPTKFATVSGSKQITDEWNQHHEKLSSRPKKINKLMDKYINQYCRGQEFQEYERKYLDNMILKDTSDKPSWFKEQEAKKKLGDLEIKFLSNKLKGDKRFSRVKAWHEKTNKQYQDWINSYPE
jgi:hypothetical protein